MGIRESLLNTITSVGNGDFIRVVTSAGASSKATLANVMKSFETGLGAKSSLTTSDYIRVVGSDNVSYKQGMGSVSEVVNNSMSKVVSSNTDASSITDIGLYYCGSWAESSLPSGESRAGYLIVLPHSTAGATYRKQFYTNYAENIIHMRSLNDGTWTSWTKLPTRAEIDALTTVTSGTVTWYTTNVTGDVSRKNWWIKAGVAYVSIEFTPNSGKIANGNVICTGMPKPRYDGVFVYGGNSQQMMVKTTGTGTTDGALHWYFPLDTTTLNRIDMTLVYPV